MTDDQFQAVLAWLHRLDMRLEAIERQVRPRTVDGRYVDAATELRPMVLSGEIEKL